MNSKQKDVDLNNAITKINEFISNLNSIKTDAEEVKELINCSENTSIDGMFNTYYKDLYDTINNQINKLYGYRRTLNKQLEKLNKTV